MLLLVRNHIWGTTALGLRKRTRKWMEKCPAHMNFAAGWPQALQPQAELGFVERPGDLEAGPMFWETAHRKGSRSNWGDGWWTWLPSARRCPQEPTSARCMRSPWGSRSLKPWSSRRSPGPPGQGDWTKTLLKEKVTREPLGPGSVSKFACGQDVKPLRDGAVLSLGWGWWVWLAEGFLVPVQATGFGPTVAFEMQSPSFCVILPGHNRTQQVQREWAPGSGLSARTALEGTGRPHGRLAAWGRGPCQFQGKDTTRLWARRCPSRHTLRRED